MHQYIIIVISKLVIQTFHPLRLEHSIRAFWANKRNHPINAIWLIIEVEDNNIKTTLTG